MDLCAYLQQLYDYHYWANDRILTAAQELSAEQLHHPHGQSWGSIHETLIHMMNAEWMWLRRGQGESPPAFYSTTDFPTLTALCEHWSALQTEMRGFLARQSLSDLQEEISYTSTLGKSYKLVLWQILVHVPNHGTHHRGELAAMFTALGAPHPEEDWVHYFLERSGQRKL